MAANLESADGTLSAFDGNASSPICLSPVPSYSLCIRFCPHPRAVKGRNAQSTFDSCNSLNTKDRPPRRAERPSACKCSEHPDSTPCFALVTRNSQSDRNARKSLKINGWVWLYPERPASRENSPKFRPRTTW